MAEIQPPEAQINGGAGTLILNSCEPLASKRQRRPSVRLGDIGGDHHYESHHRRANTTKQWKLPSFDHHRKDHPTASAASSGKPSKTRPLTNLSTSSAPAGEFDETLVGDEREGNHNNNIDGVAIGSWKVKESKKRGSKRVRSNWIPRIDEGGGGAGTGGEEEEKYSGGDEGDDGCREFDFENSESPTKDQSPVNSMENFGVDGNRRSFKGRDHHNHQDGIELSGPSDTNGRDWRGASFDRNGNGGRARFGEDGVRVWLNGLGLGRYAPVFEVHEVDDEVLPMLTLEDLKDMGISAVGSRRKMYCAIQKLGKGFS
ncbi:hypothetical protein HN51_036764 [Arachis hypogaea]|uniref:SAM domain-containing protein n=1 Tax=Arachis hypogaea TaxID=3818 RepID=A0A444ZYW2_ARAHY|nr:ankyrin repeat and SAM domain-containing protein 6-like [Arachis ipaensis]XP_025637494.1 ankyrin repeat and SAM domain-containing protein 6 [Arachis hypogaea]QHO02197.1 uncharacterized protein DS421_13g421790 [Arachis hypogaea]RYR19222.1 hypothetical protein Ahy_B03g063940 [Arachis hypogaea]